MRRLMKHAIVLLGFLAGAPGLAWSQPDDNSTALQPGAKDSAGTAAGADAPASAAAVEKTSKQTIVYRPPRRGSPRARVGGGVRAARVALPQPIAIAPRDHVGLTTRSAPALYWHLDGVLPVDTEVFFAMTDPNAIDPLVRTRIPTPQRAGMQRVSLVDLDIQLMPEIEYQWSISLIVDEKNPSKDLVATGFIVRFGDLPPAETPAQMAADGLWYDAIDALEKALSEDPNDGELRSERNLLVKQAGIEVALAP